ncbi:MAG: HDIG domain-containing metalloprotein [Candidatus Dormiibacterota bacterium]
MSQGPAARIEHQPGLEPLLDTLEEEAGRAGVQAYLVGGYVRDRLMRRDANEVDVVIVGGDAPAATAVATAVAQRAGSRAPVIFERFGTAHVVAGEFTLEFVAARSESYAPDSRKPEVRPASLEEDIRRRDFTVNTLVANRAGEVSDMTGQGLADMEAKLLRTPLPARETFLEDPLRAVRAVRFAVILGFALDPDIPPAIEASLDRLTTVVSIERFTEEFRRMLLSEHPGESIRQLRETGILGRLLPEVEALAGVVQDGFHPDDVLNHTAAALEAVAARPQPHMPADDELVLRLAVLTHDIGKPATAARTADRVTFLGHPDVGAGIARAMLQRLRFSNAIADRVTRLVMLHMRPISYLPEEWTDGAVRRLVRDSADVLPGLIELARADMQASAYPESEAKRKLGDLERRIAELDVEAVQAARPPIDGEALMARYGRPPGPWIRRVQDALLEALIDGELRAADETAAWAYLEAHPELLAE